jgi:hypothetical protein
MEIKQIAFDLSQKPKNENQKGKVELREKTSIFVLYQRWVEKRHKIKKIREIFGFHFLILAQLKHNLLYIYF